MLENMEIQLNYSKYNTMCYDKLDRDVEQFICMLTTHPQPIDILDT